MKQRKAFKKLTLNKATVVNVENFDLNRIKGGTLATLVAPGVMCYPQSGEPTLQSMIPEIKCNVCD